MGWGKRIRLFFVFVFLCLGFYLAVKSGRKVENLVISTEPALDFGMTAEEMGEYSLYRLYPYPNTPYVYCCFVKGSIIFSDNGYGEYWDVVSIVDLEKKRSLLRIRSHNYGKLFTGNRISFFPLTNVEGQPVVLMWNAKRTLGEITGLRNWEHSFVRFNGSIEKIATPLFPSRDYNHFTKINFDDAVLEELEGSPDGMKKLREWRYYCPHNIKFVLEDGTYCGFLPYRKEIVFYRPTDPPTYRVIPYDEADHLLPGDDNRKVQIEPDFLTALPQTEGKTVIFGCFTREKPGFPVYEIQTKNIESGTPDEIFKLVGREFPVQPRMISHRQDYLYSGESFFRREVNADGSLGMFSNQPEAMKWSPGKRIWAEYQPYADRLLYYRDGGIWTSGLDGSGEERVFPDKDK